MDAGVVSNFRPQAYASRMAAERVKTGGLAYVAFLESLGCRSQSDRRSRKSRRSSPMRPGIALVAPPCIRPRGARNAASHPFSAAC